MPSAAPPVADRPPSPWYRYRQHFEHNQTRPLPQVPATLDPGGPHGAGRGLRPGAGALPAGRGRRGQGGPRDPPRAPHRHRRRLPARAGAVREGGGPPRPHPGGAGARPGRPACCLRAGSNRLFRWCRRLLGLRFKLLVLLVAEVVGGELYATLAREARWPAVRPALNQMVDDEDDHLVFHVAFLRSQARTSLARLAGRCALWMVGAGALAVVLLENAPGPRRPGLDRRAAGLADRRHAGAWPIGPPSRRQAALARRGRPGGAVMKPRPRHVAIIMDGNGRWAERRGLPRLYGHERGADAVRRTVTAARKLGLKALTLYAFSEQNWGRPVREVQHLMSLMRRLPAPRTPGAEAERRALAPDG